MNKQAIEITDHAILRFVERVVGIDIEGIRKDIERDLNTSGEQFAGFTGNTEFKLKRNGIIYCFRNRRVTTCYPQK